ncbi:hypothetical protein ACQR0Z_15100 [Bradyrhizobium sp. HKCCYLS3077]|uniref:hypothetical protein n=1 Tax=Bradyrhizobium sp. HKCCYLS3077 TaxID=3420761 RepID=UPI003EB93F78
MARGLDELYVVLEDYKKLFAWAVAISIMPFAASLSELAPPWPKQIAAVTAIAQLAVLLLVFQIFRNSPKRVVNRIVVASFLALFSLSAIYIVVLLGFTFQLSGTSERMVRGFYCTQIAQASYPAKCPLLGADEMNEAGYVASRLWTNGSIVMVHVTLVTIWTAAFTALALLVGSFAIFQQRKMPLRSHQKGQQLG